MISTRESPLAVVFAVMLCAVTVQAVSRAAAPESLFDGRTFGGWNGDTRNTWRIEDGAIVAGSPDEAAPRNEFLATDREFADFELRLQYKIDCTSGCNAGVQFRTRRVPGHHEVVGYQADIGPGITGALYDESRRNKTLALPPKDLQEKALGHAKDGWVDYTVRAEGPRVRLWINGVEMLDYTEEDESIPLTGMIALQIHEGLKGTIRYRNIRLEELGAAEPGWTSVGDAAHQQVYRQAAGPERIFAGLLEHLPARPRFSTLMRSHAYRLGDRKIAGARLPALDALVGKQVELRGKALDMALEGQDIREIIPAAIRAAPERRPAASD